MKLYFKTSLLENSLKTTIGNDKTPKETALKLLL